jgi:hypothetical protein
MYRHDWLNEGVDPDEERDDDDDTAYPDEDLDGDGLSDEEYADFLMTAIEPRLQSDARLLVEYLQELLYVSLIVKTPAAHNARLERLYQQARRRYTRRCNQALN